MIVSLIARESRSASNYPINNAPHLHGGAFVYPPMTRRHALTPRQLIHYKFGQVAQLVEQRIENPRVGGSIPELIRLEYMLLRANSIGGLH